jgi:hypothetical protein
MDWPKFDYHTDLHAPWKFLFRDRFSGGIYDPVTVSLRRDVKIYFNRAFGTYMLVGEDIPWYCPIDRDLANQFASQIGVKIMISKY